MVRQPGFQLEARDVTRIGEAARFGKPVQARGFIRQPVQKLLEVRVRKKRGSDFLAYALRSERLAGRLCRVMLRVNMNRIRLIAELFLLRTHCFRRFHLVRWRHRYTRALDRAR